MGDRPGDLERGRLLLLLLRGDMLFGALSEDEELVESLCGEADHFMSTSYLRRYDRA